MCIRDRRKLLRILRIGQLALGVYGKGVFRFRIESALGDFQYVGSDFGPLRLVDVYKRQIVKRKGKLYVICKKNPKFKMRQG